jgi:hypothetical protein
MRHGFLALGTLGWACLFISNRHVERLWNRNSLY